MEDTPLLLGFAPFSSSPATSRTARGEALRSARAPAIAPTEAAVPDVATATTPIRLCDLQAPTRLPRLADLRSDAGAPGPEGRAGASRVVAA
ncbi:MAG: hypothetical protein H0X17_01715 [Deltaproteobacteria bacterium]|nr:hypothetical protein [Deltaproteobacteria bacterium]